MASFKTLVCFLFTFCALSECSYASGNTFLHYAVRENFCEFLPSILKKDPNLLDVQNKRGQTALHFAVHYQRIDCMKLLVKAGANPHLEDNHGLTAIQYSNGIADLRVRGYMLSRLFEQLSSY